MDFRSKHMVEHIIYFCFRGEWPDNGSIGFMSNAWWLFGPTCPITVSRTSTTGYDSAGQKTALSISTISSKDKLWANGTMSYRSSWEWRQTEENQKGRWHQRRLGRIVWTCVGRVAGSSWWVTVRQDLGSWIWQRKPVKLSPIWSEKDGGACVQTTKVVLSNMGITRTQSSFCGWGEDGDRNMIETGADCSGMWGGYAVSHLKPFRQSCLEKWHHASWYAGGLSSTRAGIQLKWFVFRVPETVCGDHVLTLKQRDIWGHSVHSHTNSYLKKTYFG